MKITKKTETNHYPVQAKEKVKGPNLSNIQKSLYEVDWSSVMPKGKFVGRTAKYVYENEQWYWKWLEETQVMYEWEIKVLKDKAMTPETKSNLFMSETYGCVLMGIKEYPGPYKPCNPEWYQ